MRKALMMTALVGAVVALGAPTVMAANTLAVNGTAALQGSFGLQITSDGASVNLAFVEDQSPNAETVYRAQFWLDRNVPTMAIGDAINIFRGLQDAGVKKNILVKLKRGKDGNYYIYAFCQNDSGGWVLVNKGMQFKDKATGVQIEWQAASAPGANDGFLRMYKVTIAGGAVLKATATNIDNDTKIVDKARMGLTNVPATGLVSDMYYDSFESFRTLAP